MSGKKIRPKDKIVIINEVTDAIADVVLTFSVTLLALYSATSMLGFMPAGKVAVALLFALATGRAAYFGIRTHSVGDPLVHLVLMLIRLYETRKGELNGWRALIDVIHIALQLVAGALAGGCFYWGNNNIPINGALLPSVTGLVPSSLAFALVLFGSFRCSISTLWRS